MPEESRDPNFLLNGWAKEQLIRNEDYNMVVDTRLQRLLTVYKFGCQVEGSRAWILGDPIKIKVIEDCKNPRTYEYPGDFTT